MKKICILFVLVFSVFCGIIEVNAMNTGFETEELPQDQIETILVNTNIKLLSSEPAKRSIQHFDVNYNGLIAIVQENLACECICVYSSGGVFQYGYTFDTDGSTYVEWDNDNLNIYFVRSDIIISLTPEAEVVGICKALNSTENNRYINRSLRGTEKDINGVTYRIGNDMPALNWLASSYSQITVTDGSGAQTVIYDVGNGQFGGMLAVVAAVVVFLCVFVVLFIRQTKRMRQQSR